MKTLTIGQLGKLSKASADTIRFYEKLGLVNPRERSRAGYRLYEEDAVHQLAFIQRAKSLGFTLQEIKKLLALSRNRTAQCEEMLGITNTKIREVRSILLDLSRMRRILSQLAKKCPGGATPASDCPILAFLQTPRGEARREMKKARSIHNR